MKIPFIALGISLFSGTVLSISPSREGELFPDRCYPNPCRGIRYNSSFSDSVCGDVRLGPIKLPQRFPVSTELRTYSRFGGLCPAEFLIKWTGSLDPSRWYQYPGAQGFANDTNNNPIVGDMMLTKGRKLDRFGNPTGNFLAPLGAPYIERSLPPPNLAPAPNGGKYPYNYHVYEVLKPFAVGAGPVASWFGQPGMGSQFLTSMSVGDLVKNRFLRELAEAEFDEPEEYSYDQPRSGERRRRRSG
ncbi:hypothetical protein FQN57_001518 [Myotisia sp. PD_48]|nr:hypothetical protein FQN57_001518 [Myotisia sp. PD_48]